MAGLPSYVKIVEVGPRDGLQNEKVSLPLDLVLVLPKSHPPTDLPTQLSWPLRVPTPKASLPPTLLTPTEPPYHPLLIIPPTHPLLTLLDLVLYLALSARLSLSLSLPPHTILSIPPYIPIHPTYCSIHHRMAMPAVCFVRKIVFYSEKADDTTKFITITTLTCNQELET